MHKPIKEPGREVRFPAESTGSRLQPPRHISTLRNLAVTARYGGGLFTIRFADLRHRAVQTEASGGVAACQGQYPILPPPLRPRDPQIWCRANLFEPQLALLTRTLGASTTNRWLNYSQTMGQSCDRICTRPTPLIQSRLTDTLNPILRPSMDDLSPPRPASRSRRASARCRQCERRHGAARRSGCRLACLRSPAPARLRQELQGSKSGY